MENWVENQGCVSVHCWGICSLDESECVKSRMEGTFSMPCSAKAATFALLSPSLPTKSSTNCGVLDSHAAFSLSISSVSSDTPSHLV